MSKYNVSLNYFRGKNIIFCCFWIFLVTFIFVQLSITFPNSRNLSLSNLKCTHESDIGCDIRLWQGDALNDPPNDEHKIKATVVTSYCGEEDLNIFTEYIAENSANITMTNMVLITRCPEVDPPPLPHYVTTLQSQWKEPLLDYIGWLIAHLESSATRTASLEENHVILFLSSKALFESKHILRPLDQVVQSTMENKFGCMLRPQGQMSYYHDANLLRTFANPKNSNSHKREFNNLGEWIDRLNLSPAFDGIVPVCYGSSFAVESKDLSLNPLSILNFLKAIESNYRSHEYGEITEFIERVLAALLSHQLSDEKIHSLREYATNSVPGSAYRGPLYHDWRKHSWFDLFTGGTLKKQNSDLSHIKLTLVISYCAENMSWMEEYFRDLNLQNITIISKCVTDINGYNPPGTNIVRLENVGRCDHSYAYWMARMEEKDGTDDHIVLFFKASRYLYQPEMRYRPIKDMIRIAMERGFSCGSEPSTQSSAFFRADKVRLFKKFQHRGRVVRGPYFNMGHWEHEMGIKLPDLMPMCFGGNFAAKASQIYAKRSIFQKMEMSMERGDSVEEGHFAERAWAAIVSLPLNSNETDVMRSIPIKDGPHQSGSFAGQILVND